MSAASSSSYLHGDDAEGGWGPRFFFSFYTELGDRRPWAVAEVCVLCSVFAVSVASNLWIAGAVLCFREMRSVTNFFLLNLAAADLFFALGIPLVAAARLSPGWMLGDVACRILPYSEFVCGFVLLWTLTLIAMDRYRCIVVPPYQSQTTLRRSMTMTTLTWAVAAVIFLPVAFWFHEQTVDSPYPGGPPLKVCTLVFPRSDYVTVSLLFTVPVLLLACILPLGLFVFHYYGIFRKMVKICHRWSRPSLAAVPPATSESGASETQAGRRSSDISFVGNLIAPWNSRAPHPGHQHRAALSQQEAVRLNRHTRVVGLVFLNVLVVLVMWLPITVVMTLIYLDGSRPNTDTNFFLHSHHFIWALMAALLNTAVNPLLIGFFNENFRRAWRRTYRTCRGRHQPGRLKPRHVLAVSRSPLDGQVKRAPEDISRTPSGSGGRSVY